MGKVIVREATIEDVPACIPMMQAFHEASPYVKLSFDETRVKEFLGDLILSHGKVWLVIDDYERVVGGLGGYLFRPYFSASLIAQEMFWFIAPAARQGMASLLLLRRFEAWAKAQGAAAISFSAFSGSRAEDFLRRTQFNGAESAWWRRL